MLMTNRKDSYSNCHRQGAAGSKKTAKCGASSGYSNSQNPEPDQDSSTSKYVVLQDNRERRDGPGGN